MTRYVHYIIEFVSPAVHYRDGNAEQTKYALYSDWRFCCILGLVFIGRPSVVCTISTFMSSGLLLESTSELNFSPNTTKLSSGSRQWVHIMRELWPRNKWLASHILSLVVHIFQCHCDWHVNLWNFWKKPQSCVRRVFREDNPLFLSLTSFVIFEVVMH